MKAIGLFCALCVLTVLAGCGKAMQTEAAPLRIYCGAGLRPAMTELIAAFQEKTGIAVEPDYAGSGVILARAREDATADMFMPGDVYYVDRLNELTGHVTSKTTVSWFVPCIIVAKGNPKGITSLKDFYREDVRAAVGKPKACQVGRLTVKLLESAGQDPEALDAKQSLTVNELGVWVKMNDVDAAVVWDAIAANLGDAVDVIEIPKEQNIISHVVVGILSTSPNRARAAEFASFVSGPEGQKILRSCGFRVDEP
jgi:molybdate transport system substrate-binding protein